LKKKKGVSYAKWGYIFALPFCIAYLIFMIYPIFYTLIIGFTNMKGLVPPPLDFVRDEAGNIQLLANFKDVLADSMFRLNLKNTFMIWGMNFLPQITLALALAVMFTNSRTKIRGQGFFKVVFYMPNIITAATIAMLFTSLFAYKMGPVNDLLKMLGIIESNIDFSVSAVASRLIVAFIQFWMWYGYTMIILISGILGISPELFEAADIDGANGWQKFLYVTLPNLKTIMLYTLVTSMIGGMQMFDIPFLYNSNGGDKRSIRTASIYIYQKAFSGSNWYNHAAAASIIMFLIIAVLAAIIFFMLRDKDEIAQHKIEKAKEKEFKAEYKRVLREQKEKAKGGAQ